MDGLRAMGLGAALEPPPLAPPERLALEVWHWLGGWNPLAMDAACKWFDVEDPERLMLDLLTIRDEVNKA